MRNILMFVCLFAFVQGIFRSHVPSQKEMNKTEKFLRILKRHQMDCIELTKVDPDMIVKLKAGYWSIAYWKSRVYHRFQSNFSHCYRRRSDATISPLNSPTLKLWTLCVLNKMGLMSTEGVFKLDEALSTIPDYDKENAEKIIDQCLTSKALPPAEIAWSYIKCHYQMDKYHNHTTLSILEPRFS